MSTDKARLVGAVEESARLADRMAILDLMAAYAQGVDRCDWELVRATFHPDAVDDHGNFKGSVDELIDWVRTRHVDVEQSMHFLGNTRIEFADKDRAVAETYFIARQRRAGNMDAAGGKSDEQVDLEAFCRYVDVVERRDGNWRIARRTVVSETVSYSPVTGPRIPKFPNQATRDTNDPLYAARRLAGLD